MKSGFIAIAGRPNAGKSTLLNRVLRAKVSIVTPKAQTTRERVLGILTEAGRGQIVFIDTPGIHRARSGGINAFMVNEAREALDRPNAVWYIVDPNTALSHEEPVLELLQASRCPVYMLVNKMDMPSPCNAPGALERLETALVEAATARRIDIRSVHRISATKGTEVQAVLDDTWALMPEGPLFYPDEDQLSDRPTRFFVAEKVREQLLLQLDEELPYSCAVQIENFDEQSSPPRIEAVIHVERDSQKGMVIGKAGAMIKSIGTAARAEVEEFLGEKVFLGLKVKVLKEWTRDADYLRRMGYNLPPASRKFS